MSTRGAVAWLEDGKWKGVYNHSDSYPTGLGKDIIGEIADLRKKPGLSDMKAALTALVEGLRGYGDWREYINKGICEYCGKKAGQPHSISGLIYLSPAKDEKKTYAELKIEKNVADTGYKDPNAAYHKHSDSTKNQFDPRTDPLMIQWVYLIKPEEGVIEIYNNCEVPSTHPGAVELDHQPGVFFGHFLVEKLDLTAPKKGGRVMAGDRLEKKSDSVASYLRQQAKAEQATKGIKA